jgi:hypothetical protein
LALLLPYASAAMTTPDRLERILAAVLLAPVLALALGGCGLKTPRPLPYDVKESLGRIGVVTVAFPPEVRVSGPIPLGGVGGGATGGLAGLGLGVFGGAGCFVTLGYGLPFCALAVSTPYFMVRWSIEGAVHAVPEGERRRSREAIVRAAAEVSQARLLEAVLAEGRSRKDPAPESLAVQGPRSVGERSRYRDAGTAGIDTVVEVALIRVSLERPYTPGDKWDPWMSSFVSQVDPSLCVVAEARLRLISVADDSVLFETPFSRRSGCLQFRGWARDEAIEFRNAVEHAIEGFARWTADEVFGLKASSLDAPRSNGAKEEPR